MNVVCVIAHQDDEMGCLGTLLRLRDERDARLALIVLTNGDKGMSWSPEVELAEAARIRDEEMRAVAGALGASYRCLDQPDGFLEDGPNLRLALIEAIRAAEAELIFTHWLEDYNADHVVTARATCHAALLTEIASVRTESPPLKHAPAIFHMDPGPGYGVEMTHFVALTDEQAEEKARLTRLHKTQMEVMRELRGRDYADLALDHTQATGARATVPYAEAFRPCLMERRIPLASMLP
jgi:LmbE family N-acetylglucosaminyl deacetylase